MRNEIPIAIGREMGNEIPIAIGREMGNGKWEMGNEE
jgi:hypothetical protein